MLVDNYAENVLGLGRIVQLCTVKQASLHLRHSYLDGAGLESWLIHLPSQCVGRLNFRAEKPSKNALPGLDMNEVTQIQSEIIDRTIKRRNSSVREKVIQA